MQKSQTYRTSPAYRSLKSLCKEIEAQFRNGKEKNRGAWTISVPKDLLKAMIADCTTFDGFLLQESLSDLIAFHYKYPPEWKWPTLVIHLRTGLTYYDNSSTAVIDDAGQVKGGPSKSS